MEQKLFALFSTETDAQRAMSVLNSHEALAGKYDASIKTEPWTTVGDDSVDKKDRSSGSVGRFTMVFGAVLGAGLAAVYCLVLKAIDTPAIVVIPLGALGGGVLGGVVGMLMGQIFPERKLQKLLTHAQHGRVVLDVAVIDDATETLVRTMLKKHDARCVSTTKS